MKVRGLVGAAVVALVVGGCCGRRCPAPCAPVCGAHAPRAALPPAPKPVGEPVAGDRPLILLETTMFRFVGEAQATLGSPKAGARPLAEGEAASLETSWRGAAGVEVIAMPSILQVDGEEATIFAGERAAGESDWTFADTDVLAEPGMSGFVLKSHSRTTDGAMRIVVEGGWKPVGPGAARVGAQQVVAPTQALLAWSDPVKHGDETARIAVVVRAKRIEPERKPS